MWEHYRVEPLIYAEGFNRNISDMFVSFFFGRGMMNIFPIFPLNEYMKAHFAVVLVAATAISMVPAARGSKLPVILKAKQQWHCLRDGQKNRRSTFFVVSGNVQTKQIKSTLNNPHRLLVGTLCL